MPRFTSEESKQLWLQRCAATRAAKNGTKKAVVIAAPNPLKITATNGHNGHNGVLGPLHQIESMIAALERAKHELETVQGMVNLGVPHD